MQVGIVGHGYVGRATALVECSNIKTFIYDKDLTKCEPLGVHLRELAPCCLIFICVPTPSREDGSCDASIVESVINELVSYGVFLSRIVVRSTVPVGFCKRMGVNFMPEFLTESNWEEDFINNQNWVFGINSGPFDPFDGIEYFKKMVDLAHKEGKIKSNIIHVTSTESAEAVKLVRNSFLALKVSFFNEVHEFCRKKDLNFETVSRCVSLDERIGSSHTEVPGPDGKRGFGGACFPKDTKSLLNQMQNSYMKSYVLKAAIDRNDEVDRNKYLDEFNILL